MTFVFFLIGIGVGGFLAYQVGYGNGIRRASSDWLDDVGFVFGVEHAAVAITGCKWEGGVDQPPPGIHF